jgi:hypothetical protein
MAVLLVILAGCADPATKPPIDRPDGKAPTEQTPTKPDGSGAPGQANGGTAGGKPDKQPEKPAAATVEEQGKVVLQALKEKDMNKLAQMAHPDKGIRFSPYGFVDKDKDLTFKPSAIGKLLEDNNVYEWGTYDGSGEPIKLKFADYYAKFVYDADFVKAPQTAINKTTGKGNMANNMGEAYPAAQYDFVEYHFSGFDKKFEGMDWKSLRIVFEKDGSRLLLVGIVHDQWTI